VNFPVLCCEQGKGLGFHAQLPLLMQQEGTKLVEKKTIARRSQLDSLS
jgi:hypothetical protein